MPVPAAITYSDGITGSNTIAGREGTSEVIQFQHTLQIPLDRQRGTVSGKRVHSPVTIVKEIDTASPLLYQACAEGKKLAELKIDWYRINEQGVEEKYFSHTLRDVKVAEVKAILPNTKDPKEETLTHLEEVKLMYEKIEWRHEEGYEYSDSWKENA